MKQLSSFMILTAGGGDRISFTFDEIDSNSGEPLSMNNKRNFFVVDSALQKHIDAIRKYIRENKLQEE